MLDDDILHIRWLERHIACLPSKCLLPKSCVALVVFTHSLRVSRLASFCRLSVPLISRASILLLARRTKYLWNGARYRSRSAIARAITRCSGSRFFGLAGTAGKADGQAEGKRVAGKPGHASSAHVVAPATGHRT